MSDLENFVNQPGRDKLVKDVRNKIKELGITYIYYQFVSVTGRIVGKGVPADHWETLAEKGFQLVYGATANLFVDRHGEYIGYGPESSELVGIPEPDTFVQLPWDKRVARVWCTCFRNREEDENPGGHLTSDCRGNLKIFQDQFQEKFGMNMRAGTEPEMMWLTKKDNGEPTGDGFSRPYCYHIDQFESLRPVYMKVIEYSRFMGLDIIQGDHQAYHDFASKLAERGFITFSPQNLYIFRDRFRTLQRKANPLKKSLFSVIIPQHQQIVDWLKTLSFVDKKRIAFYGLSYGGKTAMRVPPVVTDYCLSICSADFNEWVDKKAITNLL